MDHVAQIDDSAGRAAGPLPTRLHLMAMTEATLRTVGPTSGDGA